MFSDDKKDSPPPKPLQLRRALGHHKWLQILDLINTRGYFSGFRQYKLYHGTGDIKVFLEELKTNTNVSLDDHLQQKIIEQTPRLLLVLGLAFFETRFVPEDDKKSLDLDYKKTR